MRAIFAAKGRPADHPVIVHVPDTAHAAHWTQSMPDDARALAAAFWPGPLTMILPRSTNATDDLTGGQDRIGVRVPSHPVAQALLRGFAAAGGAGIAAPSANRFGRISPTTAQHVADDLGSAVDLILDGGPCDVGIESTIVAFGAGDPMLLRPGGVPAEALARVLGRMPRAPSAEAPRASGTLPSHYAPRTPSRLIDRARAFGESTRAPRCSRAPCRVRRTGPRRAGSSRRMTRRATRTTFTRTCARSTPWAPKVLLIEAVPDHAAWQAVRDRLTRATRGDDDDRD